MYIMFTYDDNYVGKQASSNCKDAVHSWILFWKKVHLVKNDQCCANVCGFFPYWWGLISSMFLRSYFTKFLFTFGSNWDYTLYFHFLFTQTYSLSLCQSTQLCAYNCNIWCDVLALRHSLCVIIVLLLICYLKIQTRSISFPFAIQSLYNRYTIAIQSLSNC